MEADSSFVGLAVSGGVDSMALAALCSQIQQTSYLALRTLLQSDYGQNAGDTPLSRNIKFQAFVVDHGVRKSSNLEAQAVSKVLEARGIPTQLLKIDWTGHETPAELPNFESLARKYRFQALGKACRDLGINSLFLAHHEDDQVETVMMRLIAGHRLAGLMGTHPASEIPECHGLHGVHESGGIDNAVRDRNRKRLSTSSFPPSTIATPSLGPLQTEFGGVRVYRPLLQFSKERLIATCREERMEWFEDHTNKDPTVTTRNAIRYMYKNNTLPTVLSKPAILELSRKSRAKKDTTLEVVNSWSLKCSVKLATRTGILRVRFANLNQFNLDQLEINGKYAAALLLRRILMSVTPQEHVNLSSLVGAVERVFVGSFRAEGLPPPTTAFTVAGLQFKPHVPARLRHDSESLERCEWLISRQPYMSAAAPPRIEIPANLDASAEPLWSTWNLYDGRFWIRVQNMATASMVIRPFREHDLTSLRYSLSKKHKDLLRDLLRELAPDSIRWTLPAIAIRDLDGKEKVLALPTLDVGLPDIEKLVKWEVRYKKVQYG